jgi:hypothetical protein
MTDGAHRVGSFGMAKSGVRWAVLPLQRDGLPWWAEPQERARLWRDMRSIHRKE